MIKRSGIDVTGKKVLVLGSGGASNTAVKVLEDMHANVVIISRSGPDNYTNLHRHYDASVIVNTTPVGMYPHTGTAPLDLRKFPCLEGVLDMIYNPARTQLLLDAEALGLPYENGLRMLVAQAKEAAEYFGGKSLDDSIIETVYNTLAAQMQNIVLIGMPGCGKSTIGALLSKKNGRKFIDADALVETLAGKPIPEIFAQDGEEIFRQWETNVLEELGKQSGLIIATGGGCVTRERNYPLLHQNSRIIWLKRDLNLLPTDGRPLSQSNTLEALYSARKPLYEAFADIILENHTSPEETVRRILEKLEA